jgi:RNA polymerase sigma factor (sigma-70 family)
MNATMQLDDLVAGAKRGEEAAFDRLVDQYGPRLFGFAIRLLSRREEAEDVVQDVFLKVVRTIEHYEHDSRFEAWLFRIAANTIRDRIRSSQRMLEAPGGIPHGSVDELDRTEYPRRDHAMKHEPAKDMEEAEDLDRVQRFLARLPLAEREVILLRHYSSMSFAEIAEMMGTPIGTALARAHRGLGKLREWMDHDA